MRPLWGILNIVPFNRRLAFSSCILLSVASSAWAWSSVPTVLLFDKKTNTLTVNRYIDHQYEEVIRFPATTGQVVGDKEEEGDLKTPEGVYLLTSLLRPPTLKKKFGAMAFYMDYPNPVDKIAGKTGFDIMLHSTDDPARLARRFDSEGCIVLKDDQIEQVKKHVRVGLTPIVVYPELKTQFRKPASVHARIDSFLTSWTKDWTSLDVDRYMKHYHQSFSSAGKGYGQWKNYKRALTQKYQKIEVELGDRMLLPHPKYTVVVFDQRYRGFLPGGRIAFDSKGTKLLYLKENNGNPQIIAEEFTRLRW
jgi:murein L,D-transpeptidase YafK